MQAFSDLRRGVEQRADPAEARHPAALPPAARMPYRRYCLLAFALFAAFWLLLAIAPRDRADWALENVLVLLFVDRKSVV